MSALIQVHVLSVGSGSAALCFVCVQHKGDCAHYLQFMIMNFNYPLLMIFLDPIVIVIVTLLVMYQFGNFLLNS